MGADIIPRRKYDLLAILILIAVGSLAFVNLLAMPPFVDEGWHIWWVTQAAESGDWLRPFDAGKPFEAWLPVPFVWAGADTLTTMRFLHAAAGLACVLLTYWLATGITTRLAAFIAALLTAICPFIVSYQRIAIVEIYLCAASLFVLVFALRFWRDRTWLSAFLLAIGLVLAAFTKFPIGFVFLITMPLALIWMPKSERKRFWEASGRFKLLVAYLPALLLLAAVIAIIAVRLHMDLRPGFGLINIKDQTASVDRLTTIAANLSQLLGVFVEQLTWPVVLLGLVGAAAGLLRGAPRQRWLISMGAAPILGLILLSSVWMSRYLVFAIPPLIVGTVCGWQLLLNTIGKAKRELAIVLTMVCAILMGHQSALIISNPSSARGLGGYVSGWTSGYGYPELAHYLQSAPDAPPGIYAFEIVTAMQLKALLPHEWKERVHQLQIVEGQYFDREQAESYLLESAPVWLVAPQPLSEDDAFVQAHLRRIAGFDKPPHDVQVTLYEVAP